MLTQLLVGFFPAHKAYLINIGEVVAQGMKHQGMNNNYGSQLKWFYLERSAFIL